MKLNTGSVISIVATFGVTVLNQIISQRNNEKAIKEVAKQISDELVRSRKITTFRP